MVRNSSVSSSFPNKEEAAQLWFKIILIDEGDLKMSMEIIKELSGKNTALFRRLLFGYLRGCRADCFVKEFKKYIHLSPHSDIATQCLVEMEGNSSREKVACKIANFLIKQGFSPHSVGRKVSSALNKIFDCLPREMKVKVIKHWISSGKLYIMRYYVYNKPLWEFGDDIVSMVWNVAERDNALNLLGYTMAKDYPLKHLYKWQHLLQTHPKIDHEDIKLWRLFFKKEKLTNEDWKWLEKNMPLSYIDLAAKRKYPVSDSYCKRVFDSYQTSDIYDIESADHRNMLISCFSRMHKWSLLKSILRE